MNDAIILHYYSNPTFPEACWLKLDPRIAYRNMFLLSEGKTSFHFELPVFENHSFSTICHRNHIMALIRRPIENKKHVIFITYDSTFQKWFVVGYYQVGKIFYYETDYFNNHGFVVGFDASKIYLIAKNRVKQKENFSLTPRRTWSRNGNYNYIYHYIDKIHNNKNLGNLYLKETRRIVSILKNEDKIQELRENCEICRQNINCPLWKKRNEYKGINHEKDYYDALHHVYNSYIYSKNKLDEIENEKRILRR